MGIFSRMKRAAKAKANSVIDKAVDPQKEVELAVAELEEQNKTALKELLSYKTTAKQMEQDLEKQQAKAADWEQKAMLAVKQGRDDLAKKALAARKQCLAEVVKIKRDRDEAAGYAIELNRSRKKVESRLRMLKLKKGTMATQIAAARSTSGNALGIDNTPFERLAQAEEMIDDEVIESEVQAAMDGDELPSESEFERLLAESGPVDADGKDPLAELKAKMAADHDRKKLEG